MLRVVRRPCALPVLQGDRAAARRKPLVAMAKEEMTAYFKLVR